MSEDLHPPLYSAFAQVLCQIWVDKQNAPKVLRSYLVTQTDGTLEYEGLEFSEEQYEEDAFRFCSFDVLLDRAAQHIPIIWQALVTGKSIAVYSPDITVLQACAVPILSLASPGKRNLLPLVMESSMTQTEAADDTKLPIWCSCDAAVLANRFDLAIDLSARTLKFSPAFGKEAGKSGLLEKLANEVANATASEGNVVEVLEQFNEQILNMLKTVQERLGDLSPASIASVNLPSDTKLILAGIAGSSVFEI